MKKFPTGIKVWQLNLTLKSVCFLLAYFGSQPVVDAYLFTLNADVIYFEV